MPGEDSYEMRKEAFLQDARLQIKSKLVGHRSNNPEVRLPIKCEEDIRELMVNSCKKTKYSYTPERLKDLDHLFGKKWHYHIFNALGDFSFIREGTFSIRQFLPKPLKEFTYHGGAYMEIMTGIPPEIVFTFVRGCGNRHQFQTFFLHG